jgi:hypothetical protein
MVEHLISRKAAHLDKPINRLAFTAYLQRSSRVYGERQNPQIDMRCEPGVQSDFLLRIPAPGFNCAEIEEVIPHRLLELIGVGIGHEHPRHVGFGSFDVPWPIRVGFRPPQELKLLIKRDIGAGSRQFTCTLRV